MASNMLGRRFSEMSADRDKVEESTTEAKGYQTAEGYVQEVVSTAPARISAANGELVQVVTRRKTVTTLGPSDGGVDANGMPATAPKFSYAAAGGHTSPRPEGNTTTVAAVGGGSVGRSRPSASYVVGGGEGGNSVADNQHWEKANTEYSRTSSMMPNGENHHTAGAGGSAFPTFYKGSQASVGGGGGSTADGASPTPKAPPFGATSSTVRNYLDTTSPPNQMGGFNTLQDMNATPNNNGGGDGGYQYNTINNTNMGRSSVAAPSPASVLRSSSASRPYGTGRFVQLGGGESPARRSVRIGTSIDTRVIEPSRMSPIQPQPGYAPVKFVTRAELRRMREENQFGPPMVPRSVSQGNPTVYDGPGGNGDYYDYNGGGRPMYGSGSPTNARWGGGGGGNGPFPVSDAERRFRGQAPLPSLDPNNHLGGRSGAYYDDDEDDVDDNDYDNISLASSAHAQYYKDQGRLRSNQQARRGGGGEYDGGGGMWVPRNDDFYPQQQQQRSGSAYRGVNTSPRPQNYQYQNDGRVGRRASSAGSESGSIAYNRLGVLRDGDRERANGGAHHNQQQPYRARPMHATGLRDLDAGSMPLHVADVAEYLGRMRGLPDESIPRLPPQIEEAFLVVSRGTFLIKYNKNSQPHERFFALRMIPDEVSGRTHPYLVWALHDKSAGFKSRVHLSYLLQAVAGVQSDSFKRMLTGRGGAELVGPFVGASKCTVPTTFAMTFVFQSATTYRTVDVVALDEQTFRCWMIVMSYFGKINAMMDSATIPIGGGVDALAPDTPRSQSAASGY